MQFGGTDFTIEMWVNCRSVNARNSRLLEFGSEELPGYSLNEDGDLVSCAAAYPLDVSPMLNVARDCGRTATGRHKRRHGRVGGWLR